MKGFQTLSALLLIISITSAQEINFEGGEEGVEGGTRAGDISGDDVNTRFIDFNSFGQQVLAGAVGTVLGNAGSTLAGNYLNNCNNRRGKRSMLMHKIEKRQAQEKSGNANPEVGERLFGACPQDFFTNNNNKCNRCSCRYYDCRRDCRKCDNYYGGGGGFSNNNNNGGGFSNNNNYGGGFNNNNNNNYVNCNSCSCRYDSCHNKCHKCHHHNNSNNNNNYYSTSNWSSWGNSYGGSGGYRNKGVVVRTGGENSDEKFVADSGASVKDKGDEEAVIFK